MDDVMKENQRLKDAMDHLKTYVSQKEKEISDLTCQLQNLRSEIELLKPKVFKYEQDSEIFRQQ